MCLILNFINYLVTTTLAPFPIDQSLQTLLNQVYLEFHAGKTTCRQQKRWFGRTFAFLFIQRNKAAIRTIKFGV